MAIQLILFEISDIFFLMKILQNLGNFFFIKIN
jgi:hypothetical protein